MMQCVVLDLQRCSNIHACLNWKINTTVHKKPGTPGNSKPGTLSSSKPDTFRKSEPGTFRRSEPSTSVGYRVTFHRNLCRQMFQLQQSEIPG